MTEIELNAEITLWDYGHCLGIILGWLHLVSLYLVFNLDSLHHPCLSIWLVSFMGLLHLQQHWLDQQLASLQKSLPGSNARWCVENWPLVSRL